MRLAQQTKTSPDQIRSRILGGAIERAQRGSRNEACLWLGCQHRDNGLDQAQAELDGEIVAATVGGPDFTRKEAINAVRSAYRRPPREPWGKGFRSLISYRPRTVIRRAEVVNRRNVERALRLWSETASLPGTIGADYYAGRGLSSDSLAHAVRLHPRSPFGTEHLTCVVALLRDLETDEPCGIHRTAISSDGKKIGRMMLGRAAKAAVKFTLDTDVTMGLGIAEGAIRLDAIVGGTIRRFDRTVPRPARHRAPDDQG